MLTLQTERGHLIPDKTSKKKKKKPAFHCCKML